MTRNHHPRVAHFPINEAGRDFVIGDIHGAYDSVIKSMRAVRFDPKVDRIFSVGDLIDRGPQSHRALGFLAMPYVHAICGNHDEDFSSCDLADMRALASVNFNGMSWISDVADEKLLALKEAILKLPIAIQIETTRGTVGLVHAEVPIGMDWPTFVAALEADTDERPARDREDGDVRKTALWGRKRIHLRDESGVKGIGRVFVGHTIQWDGAKRLGNVYAIDTGAVFHELEKDQGHMTIASLTFRTGLLNGQSAEVVSPVATLMEEGEGPFGLYATERGG